MLRLNEHIKFRHLTECKVCHKKYNAHWKVVNHIRKMKDLDHINFLVSQENQFFEIYKAFTRQDLHKKLFEAENIFCGISFANSSKIIHQFITCGIDREIDRKNRISKTLSHVPKTEEHNKKVSESVKKAWQNGVFNTPEFIAARQKGYDNRPSFAGKNNPMYGKSAPQGSGRGKGGIREDIGHYVRSRWEANNCRIYQLMGRKYEYENYRFHFNLGDKDCTYSPDILNIKTGIFYEIKGHAKSAKQWICDCDQCIKHKKAIFELKAKGITIRVIGKYEYIRFKRRFSKKVAWEK